MNKSKLIRATKKIMAFILTATMTVSMIPTGTLLAAEDDSPYVISKGRVTYASTSNGNSTSDNAVDGNSSSRWESTWNNAEEWFYVDLGKVANISSIYISWEGAYAKAYNIQISNDEEAWEVVYQNSACKGGEENINLIASARYVRINMTEKALSAYGYSFYEFQVWGTDGLTKRPESYGDNIALHKEVECSRVRDEWWMYDEEGNLKEDSLLSVQASNVNDGNDNSSFTSYQDNNQWIYVDLGQEYEIGRVIVKWTGDAGKAYDIQVSNDAESWTTVYRKLNGYASQKDNIPVYVESARYVRVYGYSRVENGSGFGIYELEVYEYDGTSDKVTHSISELPKTVVVNATKGSYITNDMYLETAKLPTYIDEENIKMPIASNDWWQSAIIKQFGNVMSTLPFKTGYSKKGLSVLTTTKGWLPTPGPTDVNISVKTEMTPDFYILPENMDSLTAYDRAHDYSDYEAKLQLCDENGVLMTTTHIKGSPYIYCDFGTTEAFYLSVPNLTEFFDDNGNAILTSNSAITTDHFGIRVTDTDNKEGTKTSESYYCISLPEGTVIKNSGGTLKITLPKNERYASIGTMLNKSQLKTFYEHGYAFVTGSEVTYEYNETMSEIVTNYSVTTELKREGFSNTTMQLMLPHQWKYAIEEDDTAMVYTSIRGDMHGVWSNTFTTVDKFEGLLPTFAMPTNSEFDQKKVVEYLNTLDAATANINPAADAYWEGKNVHPLGMGVLMADQLGETQMRDEFLRRLKERLVDWFTYDGPNDVSYFIYDEHWGTLYYAASEFGANTGICDHHFTYGYFLFGATVLSMYDKEFYHDYKDMIEIMIRDYANPANDDPEYCRFRAYDMYEGHSWAGGYADNDNGNNQESASESLFSWVSMYLWGVLTENDTYRDAGVFGFTNEMEAILQYWFDYDGINWLEEWPYEVVGQVYGGENFYGTFFGGQPLYVYGIQWLPISEYLTYYGINQERSAEVYQALLDDTADAMEKAVVVAQKDGKSEEEIKQMLDTYPQADTGWQHITWPFLSQTNPLGALEKFNANDTSVQTTDQANTYWFINAMLEMGHKSDEIIATGELSAGVYYNKNTGKYTANVWNPCSTAKEVSFIKVENNQVLGSATVAANSLVKFEVDTEGGFEYTQAETPRFNTTALADGAVSKDVSGIVEFSDTQLVEIEAGNDGATVYYTTDGTTPTTDSPIYEEAFIVSSDVTVKAIAVKEGYINSAYASLTLKIMGDAVQSEENLALGKKVEVSSLQGIDAGYAGANMVDGDYGSRWSSEAGNDDDYCIVDLGSTYSVNTVKLFWEAACGKVYEIQVSLNGQEWTTVATVDNGAAGEREIKFSAQKARYVKMQGVERATAYGYSLYEFEVYGAVQAEAPVILPESGIYYESQVVSMTTSVKGAEIKFTIDGSDPTEESATYVKPFTVDKSTVVKAVTYRKGMTLSEQAVSEIIIDGTVALDNSKITVAVGNSKKLNALTNGEVVWSSSNDDVATVDENGKVTGVKEGKATITVSVGYSKAECEVEVVDAIKLQSINLSVSELTMKVKDTQKLTYTLNPEDTTDDVSIIEWSSSDSSVVEVENGMIVAKAEGTAIITVSCGDIKAECSVTVEPKYTMEEKLTNSEYNVLLDGSVVYQSGCFEGDKDNLVDGKGFGTQIGGNWASQTVEDGAGDAFLIFELKDSYAINQIEAMYIQWKNNNDTLPTDGFKIMVAGEDDFDVTTEESVLQSNANVATTIVTEDNSNWTTVFDTNVNDATNATGAYDWAITDTGCLSILPFHKTYGEMFKYVKIAFDYEGARKAWGIQAYEVALVINDQEPVLGDVEETEKPTEKPTEEPTTDDGIERPIKPIGVSCADTGEGGFTIVMGNPGNGQTYNLYIDGVFVKNLSLGGHTIEDLGAGEYEITLTGVLNGYESEGVTQTVVVTGEKVTQAAPVAIIDGFQISTVNGGSRIIYTIQNESDDVVERGLIYGLADEANPEDMYAENDSEFVVGFAATENGVFSKDDTNTTYVMTMRMNIGSISKEGLAAEYMVRAYAKMSDGTYIYGDVESYSLYKIADYLYSEQKMPNIEGHEYMYDNILHVVNEEYKKVEFDFSKSLMTP